MKTKHSKGLSTSGVRIMPSMDTAPAPASDIGKAGTYEKPGYTLCRWVADFMKTPTGPVPRIKTGLDTGDRRATALVRCGIGRHNYTVPPGLYAAGRPGPDAEVLVTANYKLTFDHLRRHLSGINTWILVLDTKGVNVWCAAGKGTFATHELVSRIATSGLENVVAHRRLILPQLGATGISAQEVKRLSGFRTVYGPVRASDLPRFLANGRKADPDMRQVTFTFLERLVLTPVEIQNALKPIIICSLVLIILSGIGPGIFSPASAWQRGWTALGAMAASIFSGAVITPALLPFIPVRGFALKGIITGTITAVLFLVYLFGSDSAAHTGLSQGLALFLFTLAVSSNLAMNFTGATPFTSPSGVEKEMKQYMPIQLGILLISAGCWVYSAF